MFGVSSSAGLVGNLAEICLDVSSSSALVAVAEYFSGELSAMPEGCGLAGASGVCRIFFQVG